MPKMDYREIRALKAEFYEKRLFIVLFRKKEYRRHNTIETRYVCGTSHY